MTQGRLNTVLQHLRRTAAQVSGDTASDGQLLERFLARRDETAFELLVWRHAPLVFGVCRRVLHQQADVEDAFQATFLVLVRKASSITRSTSVSAWLARVAYRVALKANEARRGAPEQLAEESAAPKHADPAAEAALRELAGRLSETQEFRRRLEALGEKGNHGLAR
jgi:RNA polymerase sigma factor (sigma-70 family)